MSRDGWSPSKWLIRTDNLPDIQYMISLARLISSTAQEPLQSSKAVMRAWRGKCSGKKKKKNKKQQEKICVIRMDTIGDTSRARSPNNKEECIFPAFLNDLMPL